MMVQHNCWAVQEEHIIYNGSNQSRQKLFKTLPLVNEVLMQAN